MVSIFFKIVKNRGYKAIKILITWYGNSQLLQILVATGIDYLLTKPFSGDDVEAAIIRLIRSRSIMNGPDCT